MTISLLAVTTIAHNLTRFAIENTLRHIAVDKVIIVSDQNFYPASDFFLIDPITSRDHYSKIMLKEIHQYITTEHVLTVQYDGMAVNGQNWDLDFLRYDYIGAPWYWRTDSKVGNGGFSLRSRKLINCLAQKEYFWLDGINEDENICIHNKTRLETAGIKFANVNQAAKFSHEREAGKRDTFGFHGIFNVPFYLDYDTVKFYIENLPNRLTPDQIEFIPYCYAAGYNDLADLGITLGRQAHDDFDEKFVAYLTSIPGRFNFFLGQ